MVGFWGFRPVPIPNPGASPREIEALQFEMLIVDLNLPSLGALLHVARYRPTPRPVIVIGEADDEAEMSVAQRGGSYLARPLAREGLIFAVTLALAEGRPMRRSARKPVPRLPALIDGVPSYLLDVSQEGVRLELAQQRSALLPSSFTLRVPLHHVAVTVQRRWVSNALGASSQLWCGGALLHNPLHSTNAWQAFVAMTSQRM